MYVYAHVLDCLHESEYRYMQYAEDVYQESMAFLTTCTDLIALSSKGPRDDGFVPTLNKNLDNLFFDDEAPHAAFRVHPGS